MVNKSRYFLVLSILQTGFTTNYELFMQRTESLTILQIPQFLNFPILLFPNPSQTDRHNQPATQIIKVVGFYTYIHWKFGIGLIN